MRAGIPNRGSKQFNELPELSDRLGESLAFQRREEFLGCPGRVLQTRPLPFDGRADRARSNIEKEQKEVIRMQGLDIEQSERRRGEVGEVVGDDDVGTGTDRSRQDMAVVWIRQRKGRDQVLVAADEAVADGIVHQAWRSCQTLGGKPWVVLEDVPQPFIVDRVGPPRTHESGLGEPDQEIAQRGWIKDVRA